MKRGVAQEVAEPLAKKPRVKFNDHNRTLHLQALYAWLPANLHDAPLIDWTRMPSMVIGTLVSTVGDSPFAAHLALAAGVAQGTIGEGSLRHFVFRANLLLRNLQRLYHIQNTTDLTKELWETYASRPDFKPGDYLGLNAYSSLTQHHLSGYLEQLEPLQRRRVEPYLLPCLPHLFLKQYGKRPMFTTEAQQRRKEKSAVLAPLHSLLVALVQLRKHSAERLLSAFREACKRARENCLDLPLPFSYEEELISLNHDARTVAEIRLEKRTVILHFLLWNHPSWVIKHEDDYSDASSYEAKSRMKNASLDEDFFVQFLGSPEECLWIGELIKYRLLQRELRSANSPEDARRRDELLAKLGISYGLGCGPSGLLTPARDLNAALSYAMYQTKALLFEPESLYRAALYGAALATIALTNGSRMTELLQVSADRFKVRPYEVKRGGRATGEERVMHLQWLLPKGKRADEQRKFFLISDGAYKLLCEVAQELRKAHTGCIPVVHPHPQNTKVEDLKPERSLFQWNASSDGRLGALSPQDASSLLRFMLYGLDFRTREGQPFSVSVHLLRHVMATVARHEHEVPVEAVARVLHHEHRPGTISEATEYYSEQTEEQSLVTLAEFQTGLEEWAASLVVGFPDEQELESLEEDLRESFERWHTLLETALGFCGNVHLCPRGYKRSLCIGCPHLVLDPRKRYQAVKWRDAYAQQADEMEAEGNEVDARQTRQLVQELNGHITSMDILQVSIEDGARKPLFLQLPSAPYDEVVIDAET